MTLRYCETLRAHYQSQWPSTPYARRWHAGPMHELPGEYQTLVFPPKSRRFWTYASCCMSLPDDDTRIELHLHSPIESDSHVELLTVIAHYHRTGARLNVGHTVKFGRPWLPGSECDYGLISLPYLDGPKLEHLETQYGVTSFFWLIPITKSEADFAKAHGLDSLEQRFEETSFNYLDAKRPAVA